MQTTAGNPKARLRARISFYLRSRKGFGENSVESYERDLAKLDELGEKNQFRFARSDAPDLREW
jgi:site-specific recombinase XerD